MGALSSVIGFFSSAPKITDNIFDKDKGLLTQVGSWIGGHNLTDQELMEHNGAMTKAVQGFAVATMGENTQRSKARRKIAEEWIDLQIWLIKLNVLCIFMDYLIKKLDGTEAGFTASIANIAFSPYMWGITGAVSVFFFGTHLLRDSQWGKDK